jgi:hypothetical protein
MKEVKRWWTKEDPEAQVIVAFDEANLLARDAFGHKFQRLVDSDLRSLLAPVVAGSRARLNLDTVITGTSITMTVSFGVFCFVLFCFVLLLGRGPLVSDCLFFIAILQDAIEELAATDGTKKENPELLRHAVIHPPPVTSFMAQQWLKTLLPPLDLTRILVVDDCYRARSLSSFAHDAYHYIRNNRQLDERSLDLGLSRLWYQVQFGYCENLTRKLFSRCEFFVVHRCSRLPRPHLFRPIFCSEHRRYPNPSRVF